MLYRWLYKCSKLLPVQKQSRTRCKGSVKRKDGQTSRHTRKTRLCLRLAVCKDTRKQEKSVRTPGGRAQQHVGSISARQKDLAYELAAN